MGRGDKRKVRNGRIDDSWCASNFVCSGNFLGLQFFNQFVGGTVFLKLVDALFLS